MIETGCEATVSRVKLPFACRHEEDFDPGKLREDVKELLKEEYVFDDLDDIGLLHILCAKFKAVNIREHLVEAQMHKGNIYHLQCDNILDGLCIIYLQSMKDKEDGTAAASLDGAEDDTSD